MESHLTETFRNTVSGLMQSAEGKILATRLESLANELLSLPSEEKLRFENELGGDFRQTLDRLSGNKEAEAPQEPDRSYIPELCVTFLLVIALMFTAYRRYKGKPKKFKIKRANTRRNVT